MSEQKYNFKWICGHQKNIDFTDLNLFLLSLVDGFSLCSFNASLCNCKSFFVQLQVSDKTSLACLFFCFFLLSVWNTFPSYMLRFGAKTCNVLPIGAKNSYARCSSLFLWLPLLLPWFSCVGWFWLNFIWSYIIRVSTLLMDF